MTDISNYLLPEILMEEDETVSSTTAALYLEKIGIDLPSGKWRIHWSIMIAVSDIACAAWIGVEKDYGGPAQKSLDLHGEYQEVGFWKTASGECIEVFDNPARLSLRFSRYFSGTVQVRDAVLIARRVE